MGLLSQVKLSDEEKLATLQRLDQFREWRSLDEQRYYLSYGALITARQIQVVGGSRVDGAASRGFARLDTVTQYRWIGALPTDQVLAKVSPDPNAAGSSIKKGESHQGPGRSEGAGRPSRLMQPAVRGREPGRCCKLILSAVPCQPVPAAGHENFGRGTVAQCGETFS